MLKDLAAMPESRLLEVRSGEIKLNVDGECFIYRIRDGLNLVRNNVADGTRLFCVFDRDDMSRIFVNDLDRKYLDVLPRAMAVSVR